jgi:hypothetical protein
MAKAATNAERVRMGRIAEMGCVACRKQGLGRVTPAEVHHLTKCGRRRGHSYTVALCRWHHRGVCWAKIDEATAMWGPSYFHDATDFRARYGSDDELLAYQNRLLEERLGLADGEKRVD